MASSLSSWYHAQYASWNRTRRMHTAPFLATENTGPTATAARLAASDALLLNMNDVTTLMASSSALQAEGAKKPDTLFGPGVGVISSGPKWTEPKTYGKDELTPEVVKSWMVKSKETSQPTTTLQALVNLKRPTIRLSPLSNPEESAEAVHHQRHGLEFEFDCDAPRCSIKMHIIGQSESDDLLAFETVVDGGFGKTLKYADGAILDLEQFEHKADADSPPPIAVSSTSEPQSHPSAPGTQIPNSNDPPARNKKRFSNFPFRKRHTNEDSVAGPALPVVDADAPETVPTEAIEGSKPSIETKGKEEGGVRIKIRLEALDDDNARLESVNSQSTYLHIVRLGAENTESEEDRRPWVVKVVRREATIGVHTFHLHEIYGLSSSAPSTTSPATVEAQHAYPPTSANMEEQTSECLLCLSSPREVVLLPCRHLVACKECAVNMVEFGAGGSLVHSEADPVPPATATTPVPTEGNVADGEATANAEQSAAPAIPTPSLPAPRRKRKAKGWFCPVCRQPYTSLLRITATPPEKDIGRDSLSQENATPAAPASDSTAAATTGSTELRGFFGRPNFLRSMSRPGSRPSTAGANMV